MYARSFRYRVAAEKASRCLAIAGEMAAKYEAATGRPLRRAIMVREAGEEAEIQEIYFFDSWEEWRRLMEETRGDETLGKLWDEFSKLLGGEPLEEEWGVAELKC